MEESEATAQKETVDMECEGNSTENQSSESTADVSPKVSDSGAAGKPSEAPAPSQIKRYQLFDKVMQKSLGRFIENASFNRFASTFRPLYKKNPQKMESIYKQFIEELKKTMQDDISGIIEEGQLDVKLNELDKLEQAAKKNTKAAWRPSGDPEQDFCSFLMPYYQKQEAYMRLQLKKIQAENAALAQKVQAGRENIARTENLISASVDEWKASMTEFERLASSLCPADVFDV